MVKRLPLKRSQRESPLALVPRLYPGETVVCIAGGPSLTAADVEACRGRARVIAVKDAIRLAPWADVLYACDRKWWAAHPETEAFEGLKYGLEPVYTRPDVQILRFTGTDGLDTAPSAVRTGQNSGYQVINVAVHLGAARIILLGYDMQAADDGKARWFGRHPYETAEHAPPPFERFLPHFETLVDPLRGLGVEVVNATRVTELRTFPIVTLDEALQAVPV